MSRPSSRRSPASSSAAKPSAPPAAGDHFGFVAENIGSFKVKGGTTTIPMLAGNGNDVFFVGLLGDVRVFELD